VCARPGGRRLRRARRRLRLASYWWARSDLDEAARHGYRALRLAERLDPLPTAAVAVAEIRLVLARVERDRDDGAAARAHLDRAVEVLDPAPATPARDRLLAAALAELGNCHRRAARYPLATAVLHRARRLLLAGDPLLCEVYTSLGILAKELGELDLAAGWYARVARIQDDAGAPPADAAALQHNLAGLAYVRRRYPEAEAHARRAVDLRRLAPGSTDVELAAERALLAATIAAQQRYAEARELFAWALAACRRARPPRRYEIAAHLHHLASIAHATGRPAEAERLYRQALELKREVLGDDHPEVALVAHNLGTLVADPLDRPARAV
jgi:tetratricopeptide (TPR) repeat protein